MGVRSRKTDTGEPKYNLTSAWIALSRQVGDSSGSVTVPLLSIDIKRGIMYCNRKRSA